MTRARWPRPPPREANAVRRDGDESFTPPADWPNGAIEEAILKERERLDGIIPHSHQAGVLLAEAMNKLYDASQAEKAARLRRWRELGYQR